jgi:circadian clock protein KaiC
MDDDPVVIERCKTGIKALDQRILAGGIPSGAIVLLTGSSGVGKTTLACQFLFNGATMFGENGLLFTLTESVAQMKRYMGQYSF